MKKLLFILLMLVTSIGAAQISPDLVWRADTTSANNYRVYITNFPGAYTSDVRFIKFKVANTDTVTLRVGALPVAPMRKWDGSAWVLLEPGDIKINTDYWFAYDSDSSWFRLHNEDLYGSGGGGSSVYAGASPTTVTVGGLSSGTAISGDTYDDILEAILAPYVNPVFTAFSVTGQSTTVEVGTTLSGSKTFTWSITTNSGTVSTIDLYDITDASTLLAGTTNDGSQAQTVNTLQLNSNGATQQWRGVGNDSGGGPATFNSSTFTVTARFYRFYGEDDEPTNSAEVRALPSSAFHTGASTFTFETGDTETSFVVALPPSVTISSVIDLDALSANITSEYVLVGTVNVLDAGSTNRAYNIYVMTVGVPYSESHTHQVTTAN